MHATETASSRRRSTATIHEAVLAKCDALDGAKDGLIENPTQCPFDPGTLQCKAGDEPTCLTAAQVKAARTIMSPPKNPRPARSSFPTYEPGTELGWAGCSAAPTRTTPRSISTNTWCSATRTGTGAPSISIATRRRPMRPARRPRGGEPGPDGVRAARRQAAHVSRLVDPSIAPQASINFYKSARRRDAPPDRRTGCGCSWCPGWDTAAAAKALTLSNGVGARSVGRARHAAVAHSRVEDRRRQGGANACRCVRSRSRRATGAPAAWTKPRTSRARRLSGRCYSFVESREGRTGNGRFSSRCALVDRAPAGGWTSHERHPRAELRSRSELAADPRLQRLRRHSTSQLYRFGPTAANHLALMHPEAPRSVRCWNRLHCDADQRAGVAFRTAVAGRPRCMRHVSLLEQIPHAKEGGPRRIRPLT